MPFSCAMTGYCNVFEINSLIAFSPPGNCGIFSTIANTWPEVSADLCSPYPTTVISLSPSPARRGVGLLSSFPCKRKVTGTVYFTLTSFPFCIPGFHLGIMDITLVASRSSDGSTPRMTSIFRITPSLPTTNEQVTRP